MPGAAGRLGRRTAWLTVLVAATVLGCAAPTAALVRTDGSLDPAPGAGRVLDPAALDGLAVLDLEERLATAQSQLQGLQVQVEQAVETYDAAVVRLEQARTEAADAAAVTARATAAVAASRTALGRWAAAAYRAGGPLGSWSVALSSTGPRDLLRTSAALRRAGELRAGDLARARADESDARFASLRSTAALAVVTAESAATDAARAGVESRLAAQQVEVDRLEAQRLDLLAQVAAARGTEQSTEAAHLDEKDAAAARSTADWAFSRGLPGPGLVVPRGTAAGARRAVRFALAQVGLPYVWGAAGPDTYDCSGLTMAAWRQGQVALDHWSVGQALQSPPVAIDRARAGDLVFFATDPSDVRTIYHVGLYLGDGLLVEAPHTGAMVRVASIWRPGLFGAARP